MLRWEGRDILTLPNVLTLLRLASAPFFLVLFFGGFFHPREEWLRLVLCLTLVLASEVSDALDGFFARRLNQVSDFGKLMDPYADSAFRLTVLFSFAGSNYHWVPLWMVVVLLYRDILTSVIRVFSMKHSVVVAARLSGKLKAITQATAIIAMLVMAVSLELRGMYAPALMRQWATPIMWVVLTVAVWSGLDYAWACRRYVLAAAGSGPPPSPPAAPAGHGGG
jgi:CDP-diacylglycerol--glycerol-3-phosphate 3-phosphatidyltransferase